MEESIYLIWYLVTLGDLKKQLMRRVQSYFIYNWLKDKLTVENKKRERLTVKLRSRIPISPRPQSKGKSKLKNLGSSI